MIIGTDWAGGVYKVMMEFPDEYPSKVLFCDCFALCVIYYALCVASQVQVCATSVPSQCVPFW